MTDIYPVHPGVYHVKNLVITVRTSAFSDFCSRIDVCYNLCRNSIDPEYIQLAQNKSDVLITAQRENELVGFVLFSSTGYINLTCALPLEGLKVGLLLRCFTHNYLRSIGVGNVYTDAATEGLASYYDYLGYTYGKAPCGEYDEITDLHTIYKQGDPEATDFHEFLPEGYKTDDGYRMKMCGYHSRICDLLNR